MPALGGTPRRIASSQGEGDISHDGRRIATFRTQDNRTVLAILERDGSKVQRVKPLPALAEFGSPRWSPDDRWIAFVGAIEIVFNRAVYVMDAGDGEPKAVATAQNIQGLAWLPDGSGLVYASSAGSTMTYPPVFNLRTVSRDGGPEPQVTFGDISFNRPELDDGAEEMTPVTFSDPAASRTRDTPWRRRPTRDRRGVPWRPPAPSRGRR